MTKRKVFVADALHTELITVLLELRKLRLGKVR